jgi:ABC-type siderophore export system fused ATPase/permease subunit
MRIVLIAVAGSIISGVAGTSKIALITQIVTEQGSRTSLLVGLFIMLCLIFPVFRFVSQMLLIDLT